MLLQDFALSLTPRSGRMLLFSCCAAQHGLASLSNSAELLLCCQRLVLVGLGRRLVPERAEVGHDQRDGLDWVKEHLFTAAAFSLPASRAKVGPSNLPPYLKRCHRESGAFLRAKQEESGMLNVFNVTG